VVLLRNYNGGSVSLGRAAGELLTELVEADRGNRASAPGGS